MPSLYIVSFLFRACEEVHRIGGHVLDRTILQKFALSLLEKVSNVLRHPVLLSLFIFISTIVLIYHDFPSSVAIVAVRKKLNIFALEHSS